MCRDTSSWALGDFVAQIGFDLFIRTAALRFSFHESVNINFSVFLFVFILFLWIYTSIVMLVEFYKEVKLTYIQFTTTWYFRAIHFVMNIS